MSAANKAIVRRAIDAISRGDVHEALTCIAPNYLYHGPGVEVHGADGFTQVVNVYLAAFPDLSLAIEEQIAEGDLVMTRFTARGTHRGELAGVQPSGRRVSVPCVLITRVENEKIVEDREVFDQLGMFQQIGKLPALPAGV
jgi:steroid delta-isomerase-like uncharacterized protein